MCWQWHYFSRRLTVHTCLLDSLCIGGCIHCRESLFASFFVGSYFHVVEEKPSDMLLRRLLMILMLLKHSVVVSLQ